MQSGGHITIFNRLDEILELTSVRANGQIAPSYGTYDDTGTFNPGLVEWIEPPAKISLRIKPKAEGSLYLQVKPGTRAPTVVLVFRSSAGTLRNRRVPVEMFTTIEVPDHRPFPTRIASRARARVRRRLAKRI